MTGFDGLKVRLKIDYKMEFTGLSCSAVVSHLAFLRHRGILWHA